MTGLAHIGRVDVTAAFARCNATVVATDAGANDLAMIYRSSGNAIPRRRCW